MMLDCCNYGGVCEGDRQLLKKVILKQVVKYKERCRKRGVTEAENQVGERVLVEVTANHEAEKEIGTDSTEDNNNGL